MSVADFMSLTPSEFQAVYDRWAEREERRERRRWERVRLLGWFALQPYARRKMEISDILQFPWEHDTAADSPQPRLTRAERLERIRQAKEFYGIE